MFAQKWHAWWAWHPAHIDGQWFWLGYVERRGCIEYGEYSWTLYRQTTAETARTTGLA